MEQSVENLRVCRKCLTREMVGQEEYFRSLWEYIENLDIDVKAPEDLYDKRLMICKECEMLLEGMCSLERRWGRTVVPERSGEDLLKNGLRKTGDL